MSDQPEALRLAAALDAYWGAENGHDRERQAADELRRLHQFAEDQIGRATTAEAALQMTKATHALKIADLEAQRDALLAVLKKAEENGCATVYANEGDEYGERGCCGVVSYMPHADDCWVTMARAAIKAVEGEGA